MLRTGSSGANANMCLVRTLFSTTPRAETISFTYSPAPYERHNWRKVTFVTPAMGASTTGGSTVMGPSCNGIGRRYRCSRTMWQLQRRVPPQGAGTLNNLVPPLGVGILNNYGALLGANAFRELDHLEHGPGRFRTNCEATRLNAFRPHDHRTTKLLDLRHCRITVGNCEIHRPQ